MKRRPINIQKKPEHYTGLYPKISALLLLLIGLMVLDAFWAILCFNLTCSCNTWWLFITEWLLKNWIYKQIWETTCWREMQWFLVFGEKPEKWIEKLWGPLVKNDLNHKALGIELRMFWLKTQRLTKSSLRTERVAVPVYKKTHGKYFTFQIRLKLSALYLYSFPSHQGS